MIDFKQIKNTLVLTSNINIIAYKLYEVYNELGVLKLRLANADHNTGQLVKCNYIALNNCNIGEDVFLTNFQKISIDLDSNIPILENGELYLGANGNITNIPFTTNQDIIQSIGFKTDKYLIIDIKENKLNLEDVYNAYEIFENITSGSTGTVTIPTTATILLDKYPNAGDCLITKTDTNGRPKDEPATNSQGNIITGSLDISGNYLLSDTPSSYPVSIIFQIKLPVKDFYLIEDRYIHRTELYDAIEIGYINTSSNLKANNVQEALDEIADLQKYNYGIIKFPTIDKNVNGTITIHNDGIYLLNTEVDGTGINRKIYLDEADLLLTNNAVNYIYVDYNNGNPIFNFTNSFSIFVNNATLCPIAKVIREDSNIFYILDYDNYSVNLSNKILYKDIYIEDKDTEGLVLSTIATRKAIVSEGNYWLGIKNFILPQNVTNTEGIVYEYYLNAGVWVRDIVSEYDSLYYTDGNNRLNLDDNKWVSKYFFRNIGVENEVYYFHGNQFNSEVEAIAEELPDNIYQIVKEHSVYVGKIVIQKNADVGTAYSKSINNNSVGGIHNHLTGREELNCHPANSISFNNNNPTTITVGGLSSGTVLSNKTVYDIFDMMLYPELFPTLTNPNNTFISSHVGLYEVGFEISTITFIASFNRGSITPAYGTSGFRSGLPNTYLYTGAGLPSSVSKTDLSDIQTINNYIVLLGNQTWTNKISYDEGEQPLGSKGNNYDNPLPAGDTSLKSIIITGVYPFFATTVNINVLTKQNLQNHGSVIDKTFVAETLTDKQTLEVPVAWGNVTKIEQYNTLNGQWDIIPLSSFTKTSIDKDINGSTIAYNRYTHNGATIGSRRLRFTF